MTTTTDFQFKYKRDLLIVSCLLIFINLAEVRIDEFAVFGINASVNSPKLALTFVWLVWVYFSWRYLAYNVGALKLKERELNSILADRAYEEKKLVFRVTTEEAQKFNYIKLDKTVNEDNELTYSISAELVNHGKQVRKVNLPIENEFITDWTDEFNRSFETNSKHLLEAVLPIVIIVLTIASGIYQWLI